MAVSVKFIDFWEGFNTTDNKFVSALRSRREVRVIPTDSDEIPDLLFFSRNDSARHLRYENCIKIYFTGENDIPNFNECDYALSFHRLEFGDRHLRYPLYMLYDFDNAVKNHNIPIKDSLNREFCSFLMRNDYNCDPIRIQIADAVENYRPIAYGGPFRNNTGGCVAEKIPFISKYKFNLALENSRVPGYVTEKIVEPFAATTVPIYWGAPDVDLDFNPNSFINVSDFDSLDSFIDRLCYLDTDPKAYMAVLTAPKLITDCHVDFDARLADFLDNIVTTRRRYLTPFGETGRYHRRNILLSPFVRSRNFMRVAKLVGKYGDLLKRK